MLSEPFPVTDLYADGLHHVEVLKNGNFRFVFFRQTPHGKEALERALVMAISDIPDSLRKTRDAMQDAGMYLSKMH